MVWGAILGAAIPAVTSIISGNSQAKAAKTAGRISARSAMQAREDLAPFTGAGVNALGEQEALLGLSGDSEAAMNALTASPGFQFRFNQGVNALDASGAARGNLFSGNQGQALTRFGQNFATDEFNNRFNQLGLLAGRGQNAAGGQGAAGIQAGNALAGGTVGAADARAAGAIGASNAVVGGIGNYLYDQRFNSLLSSLSPQQGTFADPNRQYIAPGR